MLVAYAKLRQPVISYAEMNVPLPESLDVWLARNPEAWRTAYLDQNRRNSDIKPSLHALLSEDKLLSYLPHHIDSSIAITAKLCGLAAQIWEYNQQMAICKALSSDVDASTQLWNQARQQIL
jgi:hypothetical protein